MDVQHWLLLAGWLLFGILHSVTATDRFKHFIAGISGSKFMYYRLAYSMFALVSLSVVLIFQFSISSFYLFYPGPLILTLAVTGMLPGILIISYCIRFYFFDLSGVKVFFKVPGTNALKTDGLNKYVRHPLYAGTLLTVWSMFLFVPLLSNLIASVIITIYTIIGAMLEEAKLLTTFGKDYQRYRKKVPMLFPKFK